MDDDLEKKLDILLKEYNKHLPEKVYEIEDLWQKLNEDWKSETLTMLHRNCHNLHGSANIYGYENLGEIAGGLEKVANSFFNNNPTLQRKNYFIQLLRELKVSISNLTASTKISIPTSRNGNKIIYLVTDDQNFATGLISQVSMFGYMIKNFENSDLFMEDFCEDSSNILALFVSMNMLTKPLEAALVKATVPLFFISTSGEFSLRLKAVRLGGKAFLVRPLLIEDLIGRLDNFLKLKNEAYRILIIDDQIEVANYYSAVLKQANMITQIVTELEMVDKLLHDFNPDIILMDLYMPECNGFELASIIRQQNTYDSLPIIFLSNEEDKQKQLVAMAPGVDDFIDKSGKPEDLIFIIKNRASRYKTLRKMMVYDNLTGVFNHSFILQQLETELKKSTRLLIAFSVIMIDLDHFKHVNDSYGHLSGDQVLRNLCLMMRNRLRTGDLIGRYGGEEFIVILPNTSLDAATRVIDDLQINANELVYSWENVLFHVTFSAGIACYPDFNSSSQLIEAADRALYNAKKNGRNRVEVLRKN